jgi:hypothetical protein
MMHSSSSSKADALNRRLNLSPSRATKTAGVVETRPWSLGLFGSRFD